MSTSIPQHARVVIVGGGIIGCSVAYHLTKLGWTDVVLLEQGQLSCGTTWHAAGLVGQLRAQESMTKLIRYSTALYAELEADTGLATTPDPSGNFYMKGQWNSAPNSGNVPTYTAQAPNTQIGSSNPGAAGGATGISGSNFPHNNLMPYLTLNFCIALQGVFPPRS